MRHTSSPISVAFWSKTKRFFKSSASSLKGFILPNGEVVQDVEQMLEMAATHYENLFLEPKEIMRPHPFVDAPLSVTEIDDEPIPPAELEEVIQIVNACKKKKNLVMPTDCRVICFSTSQLHTGISS
jgi:hypothetical protein